MRAMVFSGPGVVEMLDVDRAELEPGAVLRLVPIAAVAGFLQRFGAAQRASA
ncbi:MAG TPA: hypothetical protein VNE21_01260 [Mycobacteriales bacterium]|nr:hypothetical protein [Mycobacteriales bacterium]